MDKEANEIREQNLKLAWIMRGGATYDQVMMMSANERGMISEIFKENIETSRKTGFQMI